MANEAQINQKQQEIATAQAAVRQAILDIQSANTQLRQATISLSQQPSESTKTALVSALDDGMDAYDAAIQTYQTKIGEYNALTDISNYDTLKGQLRSAKNTHTQLLFDLKIAKENGDDLTSILAAINTNTTTLEGHLQEYNAINDPRYLVNNLNDNTPFLLLPIRVESRYMTVKHVQRLTTQAPTVSQSIEDKKELWLRFFPDDIAIHTHEVRLTADEETAGHVYWNAVWKVPTDGKAAWRSITSGFGPERAAYIIKETEPSNINIPYDPQAQQTLNFPTLTLKPGAWTDSPRTKVMPDRFVVRIYRDDDTYREVVGNNLADPLYVGISPEDGDDTYFQEHGIINFPEQTKWMSDFSQAVQAGMGIKISLEAQEETGIAKIIVLGLKLDADKTESTALVEELVENHQYTKGGFSFIKQGTPTNNTEDAKSGFDPSSQATNESYEVKQNGDLFTTTTDFNEKKDGQWFADMLGLNTDLFQHSEHADATDICESIAMNKALWPATMGYYIKQMLQPHIGAAERERVRAFFTEFVLGRGKIPTFRIGNQPYGVISSTAFSRWTYPQTSNVLTNFYQRMNQNILQPMNYSWGAMAEEHVININDNSGDYTPSELFLKMITLHASSVQFHHRYANGTFKMWNLWRFVSDLTTSTNLPPKLEGAEIEAFLDGYNEQLSLTMAAPPKVFELNFLETQRRLNGPVIDAFDSLPYSETRGIQKFPGTEWNYIHWLIASTSTIDKIRAEEFDNITDVEVDQRPPRALLYLLLRYAYLQQYLSTATNVLVDASVANVEAEKEFEFQNITSQTALNAEEDALVFAVVKEELTVAKRAEIDDQVEQEFAQTPETPRQTKRARHDQLMTAAQPQLDQDINTEFNARKASFQSDNEKWNYISQSYASVTGQLTMEEHLEQLYTAQSSTIPDLTDFKDSLEKLKDLPTARLERIFAEHVDLCSYRLDAWINGMVNQRLEAQQDAEKGLFIGAFGLLENVEPDASFPGIHVVEVDTNGLVIQQDPSYDPNEEITDGFAYIGSSQSSVQLERDADNGVVRVVARPNANNQGYVHTPSMNHAVTAAILRAGYLSNQGSSSTDNAFAVNLTSKRVRRALHYLEGLRNGQTLPALLGYRFERELHDKYTTFGANLNQYILDIRLKYPLVTGKTVDSSSATSIEQVEARNVVDGLALTNAYEADNDILASIPITDTGHKTAINEVLDQLMDDVDAISDLLLSESVYQAAKGNSERAGAVLKALGEGNAIQAPEIVDTPRSGNVLTHRFGIQFDPGETGAAKWTTGGTARSTAEPALNGWLSTQLPLPENVIFKAMHDGTTHIVTLKDLNIEPIDFVYLMGEQGNAGDAAELSSRISYYAKGLAAIPNDASVQIEYFIKSTDLAASTSPANGDNISLLQLLPLVKSLKQLIGSSRPWTVEDYLLTSDAQEGITTDPSTSLDPVKSRLDDVRGSSTNTSFANSLYALEADLSAKIATANGLTVFSGPPTVFAEINDLLLLAANFGINSAVPTIVEDITSAEARDEFITLAEKVHARIVSKYAEVGDVSSITLTDETAEDELIKAGQALFGPDFKIYPSFQMQNSASVEQNRNNANFLSLGGDLPIEKWVQSAAKVRPQLLNYQKFRLFSDALLKTTNQPLKVTQIPAVNADDKWLGIQIPDDYSPEGDTLSLVMEIPTDTSGNHNTLQSGMLIDEWVETIPDPDVQTGVAMNFDQPNNEAPNSLILAVTPEETGAWDWDDLMDTVNETFDMAKKRAVEPDHIKDQIWGQALPALLAAISPNDATPSLDFGRNNFNTNNGQHGYVEPANYQTS